MAGAQAQQQTQAGSAGTAAPSTPNVADEQQCREQLQQVTQELCEYKIYLAEVGVGLSASVTASKATCILAYGLSLTELLPQGPCTSANRLLWTTAAEVLAFLHTRTCA